MNRVAVIPGSLRSGSLNRRLGRDLTTRLGTHGVEASLVDLADYAMPIYHGDDEASTGAPPSAVALHDRLAPLDGLIFVSPEYNGGPPALLKNTIDWVTRVDRATFRRHLVGLAAVTPGTRGGRAVLAAMRAMFAHMRLSVYDDMLSVPDGAGAFGGCGSQSLSRPDVVGAAEAFVSGYVDALDAWVVSGRDALT